MRRRIGGFSEEEEGESYKEEEEEGEAGEVVRGRRRMQ